jgi:hypothetical protein
MFVNKEYIDKYEHDHKLNLDWCPNDMKEYLWPYFPVNYKLFSFEETIR